MGLVPHQRDWSLRQGDWSQKNYFYWTGPSKEISKYSNYLFCWDSKDILRNKINYYLAGTGLYLDQFYYYLI